MAYDPHKLSMEKVASAFSPEDRMGALELQNLSVAGQPRLPHPPPRRPPPAGSPARAPLGELLALDDPDKTASVAAASPRRPG